MSDFADKLAPVRPSAGGRAQASRKKLLERWGSREDVAGVITVDTIGGRELWRRMKGTTDMFEQEVRT